MSNGRVPGELSVSGAGNLEVGATVLVRPVALPEFVADTPNHDPVVVTASVLSVDPVDSVVNGSLSQEQDMQLLAAASVVLLPVGDEACDDGDGVNHSRSAVPLVHCNLGAVQDDILDLFAVLVALAMKAGVLGACIQADLQDLSVSVLDGVPMLGVGLELVVPAWQYAHVAFWHLFQV